MSYLAKLVRSSQRTPLRQQVTKYKPGTPIHSTYDKLFSWKSRKDQKMDGNYDFKGCQQWSQATSRSFELFSKLLQQALSSRKNWRK